MTSSVVQRWLASAAKVVVVIIAISLAFWLGTRVGRDSDEAPKSQESAQADYWTCSMHPQIRQSAPGLCPICGMQLVPVVETPKAPAKSSPKYACAMMCIPPQDQPGKCPVCGMDMVPVEEASARFSASAAALSTIALSENARKLARLQVAPVERRFVDADIRMVGKVTFDETRMRTISSRVSGRLDRLYVDYTGVPVARGDHLVSLYSPELLAAQQELIQSLAGVHELEGGASEDRRRIRQEGLEAARQKLLLWGLTQEQLAEIEQRGAPSDHLTIYAPIGGIVVDKRLVEGAYVEVGTEIYTIADLTHLWVKLDAYESDLAWLRYGQEVSFTTEAYQGETFHGTVAFIDPVLNARTRTAKVRVNVPNPDGRLKPEMFVRATVQAKLTADGKVIETSLVGKWVCPMHPEVVRDGPDSCTQCGMPLVPAESLGYASSAPSDARPPLVIPATAVLLTGDRAVVYVAAAGNSGEYEGRSVRLGPRAGDYYLVYEGVGEGEQVVSQGNLYLDSAVQILAKKSMMHAASAGAEPSPAAAPPPGEALPIPEGVRTALDQAITAYSEAHSALIRDQLAEAQRPVARFAAPSADVVPADWPPSAQADWKSLQVQLAKSFGGMASASTLDAARASFEGASLALTALARRFGTGARPRLFVYHCPMAFDNRGASWLQDREGLENPYFGPAMLTCGLRTEVIENRPQPPAQKDGRP